MNADPNDFEALRKLMALKKHEQPPPEYLGQLSDRIINRIESGEGRRGLWDRLAANVVLRPTVAYAFGLTVCGALGLTAIYLVRQETAAADVSASVAALRGPMPVAAAMAVPDGTTPQLHVAGWLGKTNPANVSQPELSLFTSSRAAVAMPASYQSGQ